MIRKLMIAAALSAIPIVGFAPAASAQTYGGVTLTFGLGGYVDEDDYQPYYPADGQYYEQPQYYGYWNTDRDYRQRREEIDRWRRERAEQDYWRQERQEHHYYRRDDDDEE